MLYLQVSQVEPPTSLPRFPIPGISNDTMWKQELKKMTAFIKQEAMEKGREIELKANDTSPPVNQPPPS